MLTSSVATNARSRSSGDPPSRPGLAKFHALELAAILFAVLTRGGIFVDAFTDHVSKDIVQILQALVILFVAAEAMFRGPFSRFGLLKRSKV